MPRIPSLGMMALDVLIDSLSYPVIFRSPTFSNLNDIIFIVQGYYRPDIKHTVIIRYSSEVLLMSQHLLVKLDMLCDRDNITPDTIDRVIMNREITYYYIGFVKITTMRAYITFTFKTHSDIIYITNYYYFDKNNQYLSMIPFPDYHHRFGFINQGGSSRFSGYQNRKTIINLENVDTYMSYV